MADDRVRRLGELYEEIHAFAAARDKGSTPLAPRRVVERALESELMLLAQGLAQSTQRVTGYPYRAPAGLSPAGRRLDGFLAPLGYTIDHTDKRRTYAYSTDLVPWYPGKHPRGKGDLRPEAADVDLCWEFFEREYELVEPRVVILLGGWAADRFLKRYAAEPPKKLRLEDLGGELFEASLAGRPLVATTAFHPSAVWGKFERVGRESWEKVGAGISTSLG